MIYIPYPRVNCLKTIPFTAAHTYIAHIWQYPLPPPGALNSTAISKCVTLKMTDVPSKHVWKIKDSCYVYTSDIFVYVKLHSPCKACKLKPHSR